MPYRKMALLLLFVAFVVGVRFDIALCGTGASRNEGPSIRLSNGLNIVSVRAPAERSLGPASLTAAGEPTVHPQPPLAGFQPLVAITTSDRRKSDDFDWEHTLEDSYVGRPLNAPADENYVVGILDTGASVDLITKPYADLLGLVGPYLTENEQEIGGAGGTMIAQITRPVGIFAAGLGAIGPDGRLDLSRVSGHTNVSALVSPAIACGSEEVTAAIGNPFLAFRTTEIRVDQPRGIRMGDKTYVGPDIEIHSAYTPSATEYPRRIPVELGGVSPVTTAGYYAMFDPFDPLWEVIPTSPTALTMFALGLPTGGALFTEMGVLQGEPSPLNTIQNLRVMLDTGAQASILHPNLAARLNLPIEPDFVTESCGIGGRVEVPGYYIDYVRINAWGGALEYSRVPFVILELQSPEGGPLDGVLGMNFFWNRNVVLEPSVTGGGFLHVSDPVPYAFVDLNFDELVDVADFAIFASAWRTTPEDPAWNGHCDFYLDGVIDSRDFQAFAEAWGAALQP